MGHIWSWANPSSGAASMFTGANNVNISGGTFVVARAGSDVHVTALPPMTDEAVNQALAMLPPNKFRVFQTDNLQKRAPGSGTWFIESDVFQDWLNGVSTGRILWVIGNAGAGKTVLAAIVIAELEKLERPSSPGEPGTALAYAYCRYTESMSVTDLLLALVRQQLERNPSLTSIVKPLLDKHKRENSKPSEEELLELLNGISRQFKTTYYVLDALDEAPHDVRFDIVQALASINAWFFITSRPLGHLGQHFSAFTRFYAVTAHQSDIERLIDATLNKSPELAVLIRQAGVREEVGNMIYGNCGGMFLHAALQLRELVHCSHLDDVRDVLNNFPPQIDDFYATCIDRLNKQNFRQVRIAKTALSCIIGAQRDLTLEELQVAISYDQSSERFQSITSENHLLPLFCGLVTVDADSRLVRLVHYTAADAVKRHLDGDPLYADRHAILASTCIATLVKHDLQHFDKYRDRDSARHAIAGVFIRSEHFLEYAHQYWSFHAHQTPSPSVRQSCARFVMGCQSFPDFPDMLLKMQADYLQAIHVAAYHNFPEQIRHILQHYIEDDEHPARVRTTREHLTPFQLSILRGHSEAAGVLLETCGAMITQMQLKQGPVLVLAAYEGQAAIIRLLLAMESIDVNATDNSGKSALLAAACMGHIAVVRLLLDAQGILINHADEVGQTALIGAAGAGHEDIVRILIRVAGIAVNHVDGNGRTALTSAAHRGHADIVRLLLDVEGIAVNHTDKRGETALIRALDQAHEPVVCLLLDVEGIAVNCADRLGHTPLITAVRRAWQHIVCALLAKEGVDVNAFDKVGNTALILAAHYGDEDVVRLLLGADGIAINQKATDGYSALSCAAKAGQTAIVQLLLSQVNIDIHQLNGDGDDALQLALEGGHDDIVRLLKEFGRPHNPTINAS